jgi:hypothetical protein
MTAPRMLRWPSFWVRDEEMMQNMEKGQYVPLVAGPLSFSNVVNDHISYLFAAMLVRQKVLSEGCCDDFRQMLMLSDSEHLLLR